MALDTAALKAHCNVTFSEDDAVLERALAAATAQAERHLGFKMDDVIEFPGGPPADVQQAVLMLGAHLYANREATLIGVTAMELPLGAIDILREHRRYTFG